MIFGLASPITVVGCIALFFGWEPAAWILALAFVFIIVTAAATSLWLRLTLPKKQELTVAFFHPFANGGAGGERVLWCAVRAVQLACPKVQVVIYAAPSGTAEELAEHADQRFGLRPVRPIKVVELPNWELLLPERYPRFTLLGQALGSARIVYQGLRQLVPKVWIDTTGAPFAYPIVRLLGVRTAAYVHYPYVSTDMLQRVADRSPMYNNSPDVTASPAVSLAKLLYYYALATLYGAAGFFADVAMVNSSWTKAHIEALWWRLSAPRLVHPPCDTRALQALPLDRKFKRLYLVSLAQFRPEKNHILQLQAFARARQLATLALAETSGDLDMPNMPWDTAQAVLSSSLKLVGSCRGPADEERIRILQEQASELGLEEALEWCINASHDGLRGILGGAIGGLHSMLDEHFGISIVEYMAAGVLPIANNSGGPKEDIVTADLHGELPGFLCTSCDDYADAIITLLSMEHGQRLRMAAAARKKSAEFSDELFERGFVDALRRIVPSAYFEDGIIP